MGAVKEPSRRAKVALEGLSLPISLQAELTPFRQVPENRGKGDSWRSSPLIIGSRHGTEVLDITRDPGRKTGNSKRVIIPGGPT